MNIPTFTFHCTYYEHVTNNVLESWNYHSVWCGENYVWRNICFLIMPVMKNSNWSCVLGQMGPAAVASHRNFSKTKLAFTNNSLTIYKIKKSTDLTFTLNVILRSIPVFATINTVFERGEEKRMNLHSFEKKRGKSAYVLKEKTTCR